MYVRGGERGSIVPTRWRAPATLRLARSRPLGWPGLAKAGRPPRACAGTGELAGCGAGLWAAVFHVLVCSKREKSRGPTEKRPGSTTPRMGTAEKAASSRGVRGDRGPTRCSMSRWLNVVDGVKGSSGRGDMAAPQVRAASVTALWDAKDG